MAFISGRQLGGKLMMKRSPLATLATWEVVFPILPTFFPCMLLMTKSAWGRQKMLNHIIGTIPDP